MKYKSFWHAVILGLLLIPGLPAIAEDLLMARAPMTFPEAMLKLQNTLRKYNHTLSRVQRVDIGLTSKGYETDKYRIVFYGQADEIRQLADEYPQLIPYLPHKIAIFAEEEETMLVAVNPEMLFVTDDPKLQAIMKKWHKDLQLILKDMREE
ncbi:MAG: DUF302 domain-containing protein [Gammaproteobacteria bacterium]|nr:DUF302 domain-containing protein [Gammaproteobacteria bacterium]